MRLSTSTRFECVKKKKIHDMYLHTLVSRNIDVTIRKLLTISSSSTRSPVIPSVGRSSTRFSVKTQIHQHSITVHTLTPICIFSILPVLPSIPNPITVNNHLRQNLILSTRFCFIRFANNVFSPYNCS